MNNEVLIYGAINVYSAEEFINSVNNIEGDSLVVRMDTDGGDPQATYGMVAKFNEFKGEKLLKVDGRANSSGFFFVAMVDNVEALDVSQFIVHRAAYSEKVEKSPLFEGEVKANLKIINDSLMNSFSAKINVPLFEEMKGVTIAEIFSMDARIDVKLSAEEAVKIGLIKKYNKLTAEMTASIDKKRFEIEANYKPKSVNKSVQIKVENMTKEEFKAANPDGYKSIVEEGVAQKEASIKAEALKVEAKRVEREAIKAELLAEIKASQVDPLANIVEENAPVISAVVAPVIAEMTELEKISAKLDKELGLIIK